MAAASSSKLPVDHLYRQSLGMIELDSVRQLKQFALGSLGRREGAFLFEFHSSVVLISTGETPHHHRFQPEANRINSARAPLYLAAGGCFQTHFIIVAPFRSQTRHSHLLELRSIIKTSSSLREPKRLATGNISSAATAVLRPSPNLMICRSGQ